jgi:hypothetical protein
MILREAARRAPVKVLFEERDETSERAGIRGSPAPANALICSTLIAESQPKTSKPSTLRARQCPPQVIKSSPRQLPRILKNFHDSLWSHAIRSCTDRPKVLTRCDLRCAMERLLKLLRFLRQFCTPSFDTLMERSMVEARSQPILGLVWRLGRHLGGGYWVWRKRTQRTIKFSCNA